MSVRARPRSLTGIQPTGIPHLGNYVGAIRPALELVKDYDSHYFIADCHALTSVRDPDDLRTFVRSVAATWIAAGLDPDRTTFYLQSAVPETCELTWILSCVTGKGLINRAHAYKAARERNREAGVEDLDAGINMGLFNYPVLMTADILLMESDVVPVGADQRQHVEYAADIAGSFNHLFGAGYRFTIPRVLLPADQYGRTLPGTDGRKMSKSYGNTIPLFAPESRLRTLVRKIPTDSAPVEAPKDPDSSSVFQILEQVAPAHDAELVATVRKRLGEGGMGWGELKDVLVDVLDRHLGPARSRYHELIEPGSELDDLLAHGAEKARKRALPVVRAVRKAVGLD